MTTGRMRFAGDLSRFVCCAALCLSAGSFVAYGQPTGPDRLLVGSMQLDSYAAMFGIPLPTAANQKFCQPVRFSPIALTWAYVPTAAERTGDFSAFASNLVDPLSGLPFPNQTIPADRIPGIFAWRLAPDGPLPGEPCLDFPAGQISFSDVFYITGRSGKERITATALAPLLYQLGSPDPPRGRFNISGSVPGLDFAITSIDASDQNACDGGGCPAGSVPHPWLSIDVDPCCTAPAVATVSIQPAGLRAGTYTVVIQVSPINVISDPQPVLLTLVVSAPASWLTVTQANLEFVYTLGDAQPPDSQILDITSLGAAGGFSATAGVLAPPGAAWLTVSPTSGSAPTSLTVSIDPIELQKLGRGSYVGFIDVSAPGAPNSPQRIIILLQVFPGADFTATPTPLTFSYNPGDPTPAAQSVALIPVDNPTHPTDSLQFNLSLAFNSSSEPVWLRALPSPVPITGDVRVTLDPSALSHLGAGSHKAYLQFNAPSVDDNNTAALVPVTLNVSAALSAPAQVSQVLAQVADGKGWKTKIILVNSSATAAAPFTIRFWPGKGARSSPLVLENLGAPVNNTVSNTIPKGGTFTIDTEGSSPDLWQGWAEVSAPPAVAGTAIYRNSSDPAQDIEGSVPLKAVDGSRFVVWFDNTALPSDAARKYVTSMAIVNASADQQANISVVVRDENGVPLPLGAGEAAFQLAARGHDAFELKSRFSGIDGKRGTAEFTSSNGAIVGVGLRFSPRFAFTSVEPLISSLAGKTLRIAQVADGQSWKTGITIVNLDSAAAGITLRFHTSSLTPAAALSLDGLPLVANKFATSTPIPPGGSLTISTKGDPNSPLWVGWADLTSTAKVAGFAIFRQAVSATNDSEGSVPFSTPGGTRLLLPFDNTNGQVTSMAIASPNPYQPVSVSVALRDPAGNAIPTSGTSVSLAASGHTAFEFPNKFGTGGTGVADFTSPDEIFGIGLLFNARHAFASLPIVRR
jgi:hypothetical protein